MVLIRQFLGLLFLAVTWLPMGAQDPGGDCQLSKKERKALDLHFTSGITLQEMDLTLLPSEALEHLQAGDCIMQCLEGDNSRAFLLRTRALGRYDYFDYSVLYSSGMEVIQVVVTRYRSTHGAGISQKKWLSQFKGYRGQDLTLGKDIDAVSGGTLSASSLLEGLQRCHKLMGGLPENKRTGR